MPGLDPTQRYCFEVEGVLHVPRVLCGAELSAAAADPDTLIDHPRLVELVTDAIGSGAANIPTNGLTGGHTGAAFGNMVRFDRHSSWLGTAAAGALFPPDQAHPDGEKLCMGLQAVWGLRGLDELGGAQVVVVPSSHKSTLSPPSCVMSGEETFGATKTFMLRTGDLLLTCATVLQSLVDPNGQVVACLAQHSYLHSDAAPYPSPEYAHRAADTVAKQPVWMSDLTEAQRAIVGPRTVGYAEVANSDGEKCWTTPRPANDAGRGGAALQPPSLFSRKSSAETGIDPVDAWLFDLRGYLLCKHVMDDHWLASANAAFDAYGYDPENIRLVPEACLRDNLHVWPEETSQKLRNAPAPGPSQATGDGAVHRPRFGGLYTLQPPHCEPFRRMIAHPPIVQRLNWLLGLGYHEAFEPMACIYPPGTCGGSLHAAPRTHNPLLSGEGASHRQPGYDNPFSGGNNRSFRDPVSSLVGATCGLTGAATGYGLVNGRFYSEGVNVSWALDSATDADGGFVTIAGGHKARYPYQGPGTEFSGEATAIDHPLCTHVPLEPGDVLIFNARSTPHGVLAWRGTTERRCVIQFNNPRNTQVSSGQSLGTLTRNEALVNAGVDKPPGWDLSEVGFSQMMADLGLRDASDYIAYKAGVGFADHVSNPRL